jgi:hypothetical protein
MEFLDLKVSEAEEVKEDFRAEGMTKNTSPKMGKPRIFLVMAILNFCTRETDIPIVARETGVSLF